VDVAARSPVGGVIIGCCTSARLQFEWILLRSGQRIIASFRQKRQIAAARRRRRAAWRVGAARRRLRPPVEKPSMPTVAPPGAWRLETCPN